jgi:hypothetical protein
MKKEASVIRDMSSFPEDEQVQFWHEEFVPLLAQEHALRERLALAGQRVSSEPTSQQGRPTRSSALMQLSQTPQ